MSKKNAVSSVVEVPSSLDAAGEDPTSCAHQETSPIGDPEYTSSGSPTLPSEIAKGLSQAGAYKRHKASRRKGKHREVEVLPPALADYANRLDPSTFKPWLMIVRLRCGNYSNERIQEATGIDTALLNRIISNPVFMGFEAVYRSVHLATPELDEAGRKLAALQLDANEALEHWVKVRDPKYAHLSLGAARTITSFNADGMAAKKRRVGIRVDLTDDFRKRLEVAIEE